MTRSYTLKRRAEQQAETRHRIVEAAVELHGKLGPARTPFSMVAERAGVQRKTLYAHFPDERALQLACSAHAFGADPPPDAEGWAGIGDPYERLSVALSALHQWYGRNAKLLAAVLRDAEYDALTRETVELRFGPLLARYRQVLGSGFNRAQQALVSLALAFSSWRILVEAGLERDVAIDALVQGVRGAG